VRGVSSVPFVGLDVYVGTLTRYLVGDWELVTERTAREAGIPFQIVRSEPEPEDAIRDPDVVREAVLEWRAVLARGLGTDLSWSEADEMPYFTDKPDWRGYFGLLFLAAHDEHPERSIPEELPERPHDHPLLQSVTATPKRRLFRRSSELASAPRYFALYTPELWLPIELDAVWSGAFVNGQEMMMSSTLALRSQLRGLARSLGADEPELDRWRRGGGGNVVGTVELAGQTIEQVEPGSLRDEGRFALAVFLELAEQAVQHDLPLKLDY
jgi:hypothetical protein